MPVPTFDATNMLIILPVGERLLDVRADLYSEWKKWSLLDNNLRFEPAFSTSGGDPTSPTSATEPNYFLRNDLGWRIRPSEEDQETKVVGNLFRTNTALPLAVATVGGYTVLLEFELTNRGSVETVETGGGSGGGKNAYVSTGTGDVLVGVGS